MKMKKFFALLLSLSMALSLAACGSKGADESSVSQSGSDAASDLHLGYDLNTGESFYGPYYDEWSDKTDEELYEEAL